MIEQQIPNEEPEMEDAVRGKSVAEIREAYCEQYKMNLYDWLVYHQKEIVFTQCKYFGITTYKNPFDIWIYQEIIHEVKPDVILEIGSAYGGSTLFFAHLLDAIGEGKVFSLDIDRSRFEASHERIIEVTGDSTAPEIVEQVRGLCEGYSVLVFHDGDHSRATVLHDLRQYSSLVTPGSYFIVEDGIVDIFNPGEMNFEAEGPLYAIQEFLAENPKFVIDQTRERYLMTYNPHGFLKRIADE